MRNSAVLLFLPTCGALHLSAPAARPSARPSAPGAQAALGAALSALLLATPVQASMMDTAMIEAAEASRPILLSLKHETFDPFVTSLGGLLLELPSEKLTKTVDLGLDAFASVPADQVATATGLVKEAFAGLDASSCDLVPLPPAHVLRSASGALATIDQAKLKVFGTALAPALKAVPKTDGAVCLPSAASLSKLALAQGQLASAVEPAKAKAFEKQATYALRSIPPNRLLKVLPEAQKQTMGASLEERKAFKKAGARLEAAANLARAEAARR